MTTHTYKTYKSGNLQVRYEDISDEIPQIKSVIFKKQDFSNLITAVTFSTLLGTKKYSPYKEIIHIDPHFQTLSFQYFDEITELAKSKPDLAVGCADFFFNYVCRLYWNLIINAGSKNLAVAFLKNVCQIIDEWEKKRKKRVHKGTPYYFLTYGFRQEGDIDSAFASMFKAIEEDRKSEDPILGEGAYRTSPAYKYVSLIDDKDNYLYGSVIELRNLIKSYIRKFNKNTKAGRRLSIRDLDERFLQNDDPTLEQIKYLFTYCLEEIKKYLRVDMPSNDFYKIRNANSFFDLCLITDKILQTKYEQSFRRYVKRRDMSMGDGIALLFEDKGWIGSLSNDEKKNPRGSLKIVPKLHKNNPTVLIDELFLNSVKFTCNGNLFNSQMRVMQLALKLRNYAGHNIRKQDVFVQEYPKIVEWLLSAIFIAVLTLSKPKKRVKKETKPEPPPPSGLTVTTISTGSSSFTPVTSVPPKGTLGWNHLHPENTS